MFKCRVSYVYSQLSVFTSYRELHTNLQYFLLTQGSNWDEERETNPLRPSPGRAAG